MSKPFKARDLLNLSEEEIWSLDEKFEPLEGVPIEFDSTTQLLGGIEMEVEGAVLSPNIRYTILSWYLWQFHRWYPETPLLPEHHLANYKFTVKVLPTVLTAIANSVMKTYWGRVTMDEVAQRLYQVSNNLYNVTVGHRLSPYVETMSAIDYQDLLMHPDVQAVRNKCLADMSPKSIRTLYEELPATTSREGFLHGNAMVADMNIKSSPIGQTNQCIGIRGYTTDINSYMFRNPIPDCFGGGIHDISDFIQESRSASKALLFQKDPIRTTEYFNRRLQKLCQTVQWIIPGDCGTTNTLRWQLQPGDISALKGTYYLDDEDGKIKPLTEESSKKLIGKVLCIRSPLMCSHAHKGGVCETCLGQVAYSIPKGTNLGHVAAYITCEKITQKVLSVKHLDGSTEIRTISLDATDLKFVRLSTERTELIKFVKDFSKYKNAKLLLNVEDVGNLTQAMAAEELSELSIYKVSTLYKVGIQYDLDDEGDVQVTEWITVSGPSRPSSLTISFLNHIKQVQYQQDDSKYLSVSLEGWDVSKPVFKLPQKQINMLDFMRQLATMIESGPNESIKKGLDPSRESDLTSYVRMLHEYSSQYIDVPLVYLQVITLAGLIANAATGDLRLPSDVTRRDFASESELLFYRSLGPALAYEEHANTIYSSRSFNKQHRVPHPMDALFHPDPNAKIFQDWPYSE